MTAVTPAPSGGAFGQALAAIRYTRRLSQSRLAEAAGIDHSSVSRLEGGQRVPSRAMVMALADALQATGAERDQLMLTAGYRGLTSIGTAHRVVQDLNDLLDDGDIDAQAREDVRNMVALLVRQARRAVAA